ncbi:MAG: winged helix-turn-helix domain-containing tetratricopeptide repeat protein [Acetobacteraceae bacterium]
MLDLERRELRRGAELVPLEPLAFDLLAYLLRHRARVVGKDELFQAIWNGRIVSDAALTTRVNAVRRAIGDNGKEQRLVRTLRRKGMRFVGEVTEAATIQEAVESEATAGIKPRGSAAGLAGRPPVAICPFTTISGDVEERWFADGLVEDFITALAHFGWLSVASPVSNPSFGGDELAVTPVGSEPPGRYVVHGAVRREGRQVRVTARLMDATGRAVLWAGHCDGLLEDRMGLQHQIASIMACSVERSVLAAEAGRCAAAANLKAAPYDLRLRAQPIFSAGRERVLRSLGLLERAITLDPNYGWGLADAANCRQILDVNGWAEDRRLNRRKAISLARAALRVSSDAEPVAISAFVLAYFGQDTDVATALIDDALRLNPSFAKGWYMCGFARLYAGQPEQAIECFETSLRLNPRDRVGRRNFGGIGFAHLFIGRFDEAVSILRPVIYEFPHWATPYCVLASCHAHLGHVRESEAVARRLQTADACPVPSAVQFRDARHRELLIPGLKLAGMAGSTV